MNKNDLKLLLVIIILILCIFLFYFLTKKEADYAYVYRNDKLIEKIDLDKDNIYEVMGKNGIVKIQVKNKKIGVIEENSKYHICSKQGFINDKNSSIICLPNEIIIKFIGNNIDTVSR